jgi:regulator of protease activity HflC (stomatin/prohibitin superfamily)
MRVFYLNHHRMPFVWWMTSFALMGCVAFEPVAQSDVEQLDERPVVALLPIGFDLEITKLSYLKTVEETLSPEEESKQLADTLEEIHHRLIHSGSLGKEGCAMSYSLSVPMVIVLLSLLTGCGSTVQPGQRGLRWHPFTEGLSTKPLQNGFYWRAPWNDVYVYDVKWQSYTEPVDALSADDLQVNIKAVVILRPIAEEIHDLAQEVGSDFYSRIVRPEFMASVRSVVSGYPMVTVPEKSVEIASKVQAVVVEKLKGRHLEIQSIALADVDFPQIVLSAIEQKQAKEQQKEQKEFELIIAEKDAEIARRRARGQGDAIRIRSEGEAQGMQIRAEGQARAQEKITKTLTPEYLRYKLYDSPNSKVVLVPDQLKMPVIINPGTEPTGRLSPEDFEPRPLTQGEGEQR